MQITKDILEREGPRGIRRTKKDQEGPGGTRLDQEVPGGTSKCWREKGEPGGTRSSKRPSIVIISCGLLGMQR